MVAQNPVTLNKWRAGFCFLRLSLVVKGKSIKDDPLIEDTLFTAVENIKSDRSETDVLYELLLKDGLDLALPIEKRKLYGKTVYIIAAGALIVCLAKQINLEVVVGGIAALKGELNPEVIRVVFKDSGFKDDVVKTNAVQILRQVGIDDMKSL